MTITNEKNGSTLTLALAGRLDTTTAPQLEKEISEISDDVKELIVDFKELEYISSAGLRVMLAAHKKMSDPRTMRVINVCGEVMDVFEMTGFNVLLHIG